MSLGLTPSFRGRQQFSIHITWLRSMALLELCNSLRLCEMCLVSFSLKETFYRKLNAIHNGETLTKTLEFSKHLGKGLGQNPPRGRGASRMPLPHCLCFASHSSLGSLMHAAFRVAGSGARASVLLLQVKLRKPRAGAQQEKETEDRKGCALLLCALSHT